MRNAFMKHIHYFVIKYIFIHVCLFFRMALVESSDKNIRHRQTLTKNVQISLLIHTVWCNQQIYKACSFTQFGVTNKCADQPAHSHSLV